MDGRCMAEVLVALTFGFTITGYAQEVDLSILLEHHQASMFLQSSGQTYLLGFAGEQRGEKPPLNAKRIAGESLLGGAGSYAGAVMGLATGYAIAGFKEVYHHGPSARAVLVTTWIWAVWSLGSATGVYIAGDIGNETGSFLATMCGAAAGSGVGILSVWADDQLLSAPIFLISAPTIGAIVGFNLTRKYKSPPAESETALINSRDGEMSLAVPRVYLRPDSPGRSGLSQSIDLLRVRF